MPVETHVSIGQVKRDLSELVNRVAYGGERVVLTSRGKPKAVIISPEDYERLKAEQRVERLRHWEEWLAQAKRLSQQILVERGGMPIDVDEIKRLDREELESRHDWIAGDH
jgi:prevent-host-death family protein